MPLGIEVGISQGNFVSDGDSVRQLCTVIHTQFLEMNVGLNCGSVLK